MTQLIFGAAGAFAALWFAVHLFAGGRQIARPLVEAHSLPSVVRHTQYLCWHFTSVAIAGTAIFFGIAAVTSTIAFATAATLLAAGFFFVGVGLVVSLGESHARLPQGWLFLPVAALGVVGHFV